MSLSQRQNLFSEITHVPHALTPKTYPSLNGLRGISIIMVLIYHFIDKYHPGKLEGLKFIGHLGVNIFFVISGFLITTLCLKEKVATNRLSLKNFYLRRIIRILPVAYLYIITIAILNCFFNLQIAAISFITAIFFIANIFYFYQIHFDWDFSHFWSISVEEQFYILFPVFIKYNFKMFVALILFTCFGVPIVYYLQIVIGFLNYHLLLAITQHVIKFQGIAVGCFFAILFFKNHLSFGKLSLPITILCILAISLIKYTRDINPVAVLSNLLISICIGLIIVNNIYRQQNIIYNFLNTKALNMIGRLSYSIYIWQQLFLSNDARFPLSKYPYNLIFLIIVPLISYFTYERFFLKFKKRYKTV